MTYDEVYWQKYEAAPTVSQINPNVTEVKVTTAIASKDPVSVTLSFDSKYMMRVKCPNIDCDSKNIDLSNEIFSAVKSGMVSEGTKRCTGHLKKYSHNKSSAFDCETFVKYKIEPVLK